jgi:hypothetical protein
MLLALLAAVSSQSLDARGPVAAEEPATAIVRIVRAAEIRQDRFEAVEGSVKRITTVRESDGTVRSASLIEFY